MRSPRRTLRPAAGRRRRWPAGRRVLSLARRRTVLVVTVTLAGSLAPVAALDVTRSRARPVSENEYATGAPIAFPTTFTAELPARVTGELTVEVRANDAEWRRRGAQARRPRSASRPARARAILDAAGLWRRDVRRPRNGRRRHARPGRHLGGNDDPRCGNGRIDIGETCDTAISPSAPGACPRLRLRRRHPPHRTSTPARRASHSVPHDEILVRVAKGDKCCPTGAIEIAEDAELLAHVRQRHRGRGRDDARPPWRPARPAPCPTTAPPTCNDGDDCTQDVLVSAGTCSAVCAHTPVLKQSGSVRDGCCPARRVAHRRRRLRGLVRRRPPRRARGDLRRRHRARRARRLPSHVRRRRSEHDGRARRLDLPRQLRPHAHRGVRVGRRSCCQLRRTRPGAPTRTARRPATTASSSPAKRCDTAVKAGRRLPRERAPPRPLRLRAQHARGQRGRVQRRCSEPERRRVRPEETAAAAPSGCAAPADPDCSPSVWRRRRAGRKRPETCADFLVAAGSPGACPRSCAHGARSARAPCLVSAGTCPGHVPHAPRDGLPRGRRLLPAGRRRDPRSRLRAPLRQRRRRAARRDLRLRRQPGRLPTPRRNCPAGDACTPVTFRAQRGACSAKRASRAP